MLKVQVANILSNAIHSPGVVSPLVLVPARLGGLLVVARLLLVVVEVSGRSSTVARLPSVGGRALLEGVLLRAAVKATAVPPSLGDTSVLLLRRLLPPLILRTVCALVRATEVAAVAAVAVATLAVGGCH